MKADFKLTFPIAKRDDAQRIVTGIVLEPDVVDAQNEWVSVEEIEKAAHAFMRGYRETTKLGIMHEVFEDIGVHLVESYIAPVDFSLPGGDVKVGSWVMSVYVEDDDLWQSIRDGGITGFSIHGTAKVLPDA